MNPSRCRTPTLAGDRMKLSDGSLIFVAVVIYTATPADVEEPFRSRAASTQTVCRDQRDPRQLHRRVIVRTVTTVLWPISVPPGLWLGGPAGGLGWAVDRDELVEKVYEQQ
jgi:hypothetical protein